MCRNVATLATSRQYESTQMKTPRRRRRTLFLRRHALTECALRILIHRKMVVIPNRVNPQFLIESGMSAYFFYRSRFYHRFWRKFFVDRTIPCSTFTSFFILYGEWRIKNIHINFVINKDLCKFHRLYFDREVFASISFFRLRIFFYRSC